MVTSGTLFIFWILFLHESKCVCLMHHNAVWLSGLVCLLLQLFLKCAHPGWAFQDHGGFAGAFISLGSVQVSLPTAGLGAGWALRFLLTQSSLWFCENLRLLPRVQLGSPAKPSDPSPQHCSWPQLEVCFLQIASAQSTQFSPRKSPRCPKHLQPWC